MGKFTLLAAIVKVIDNSFTATNPASTQTDGDFDEYGIAGFYTGKNWEAGLLYIYYNNASTRTTSNLPNVSFKNRFHTLQPYAKAVFGPVAVQAELNYYFGKNEYDAPGSTNADISSLAGFIDVLGTFGRFYVGGIFAYVQGQGDDPTKINNVATGGRDWKPTLILWNDDYSYWIDGSATAINKNNEMTNGYLYQLKGGIRPTDKLDIGMAVAFAQADRNTVANQISRDYGWEIDVTGTYKLTNNLSYMLGVGYLLPGDAYKGANSGAELTNTYLVINKLTFTF